MGLFGLGNKKGGSAKEPAASATVTTVKDPVCGMDIDPRTAAGKSEYMGKPYYFCSPGCKKTFDASPAKFASAA